MSEKRFTYYYERGNEVVIEENGKRISTKKVVEKLNEQQATIENLRKWLIAEQKQVEKRDAFIEQKGLMSEFVKELQDE